MVLIVYSTASCSICSMKLNALRAIIAMIIEIYILQDFKRSGQLFLCKIHLQNLLKLAAPSWSPAFMASLKNEQASSCLPSF